MSYAHFKTLYKIAHSLNKKVHIQIIDYLKENDEQTLCMREICRQCGFNVYRAYHYFRALTEIGVIHVIEDGTKKLVFLDWDRLEVYESTAKYLQINMSPRTKERDKKIYG